MVTDVRIQQLSIPIIALTIREEDRAALARASDDEDDTPEGPSGPLSRGMAEEPVEGVFIYRDGAAHFTAVDVGIAGQEYFEVLSGLSEGDVVVSGPYQIIRTLSDGDAVTVEEDEESGGPAAAESN